MLHFLRRHSRSRVIKVVFVGIIGVFTLWGVGSIVNDQAHLNAVATVDGRTIDQRTYQRAYRNLVEAYRSNLRERFSPEMVKSLDLPQRALDALIDRQLMTERAKSLGFSVSDQEIRDALLAQPAFQSGGRFDKDTYVRVLRASGVTPAEFEINQRDALAVQRLQNAVMDGVEVSEADARAQVLGTEEKVALDFVKFRASEFTSKIEVSDADLQKWFEDHKDAYMEPEKVSLEVVAYPAGNFEADIALTDREIHDYYDEHEGDRFTQQEEVKARHVLIKVKPDADDATKDAARKKAEEVRAKALAGESFAGLASQYSEDEGSAKRGGELGSFSRGRMVKPFEDAAFSLEPGQISEVIETPFGLHVILVESRQEQRVKLFDEVRGEIETTLKAQKAAEKAQAAAAEDKARVATGTSIDDVAKARGLEVQKTEPLSPNDTIPGVGRSPALVGAALKLEAGAVTEPVQVGPVWAVARVQAKVPPRLPELEKVKSRLESELRLDRARVLANAEAEKLLEAAKTAGSLQAAAKAAGRTVDSTPPFTRASFTMGKIGANNELRDGAFRLEKPDVPAEKVYVVAGDPFVVTLKEKVTVDAAELTKKIEESQEQLLAQRRDAVLADYVKGLKARARIDVNRQMLDLDGRA